MLTERNGYYTWDHDGTNAIRYAESYMRTPFGKLLRDYLSSTKSDRLSVLDVGVNDGVSYAILAQLLEYDFPNKSFVFYGLDRQNVTLDDHGDVNAHLPGALSEYVNTRIEKINSLAQSIPLSNESIDIVLAYHSVGYLPDSDYDKYVLEASRVIKRGGIMMDLGSGWNDHKYSHDPIIVRKDESGKVDSSFLIMSWLNDYSNKKYDELIESLGSYNKQMYENIRAQREQDYSY